MDSLTFIISKKNQTVPFLGHLLESTVFTLSGKKNIFIHPELNPATKFEKIAKIRKATKKPK